MTKADLLVRVSGRHLERPGSHRISLKDFVFLFIWSKRAERGQSCVLFFHEDEIRNNWAKIIAKIRNR